MQTATTSQVNPTNVVVVWCTKALAEQRRWRDSWWGNIDSNSKMENYQYIAMLLYVLSWLIYNGSGSRVNEVVDAVEAHGAARGFSVK